MKTVAAVIVNWIKLKKDLFKRGKKKQMTKRSECVASGRKAVTK